MITLTNKNTSKGHVVMSPLRLAREFSKSPFADKYNNGDYEELLQGLHDFIESPDGMNSKVKPGLLDHDKKAYREIESYVHSKGNRLAKNI